MTSLWRSSLLNFSPHAAGRLVQRNKLQGTQPLISPIEDDHHISPQFSGFLKILRIIEGKPNKVGCNSAFALLLFFSFLFFSVLSAVHTDGVIDTFSYA